MPTVNKSAQVPYSTEQMYALVNDIERYPEFLSWCRRARILKAAPNTMDAELVWAIAGFERKVVTHNRLEPGHSINLRLLDGPLKQFTGGWQFVAQPQGCEVRYQMTFSFPFGLGAALAERALQQVLGGMVDAFVRRARVLYG